MPQGDANRRDVKKVVLAYSGGLDTSIILKWLQTTYGCEVVTFTADLGQGEELAPAREKALLLGIKPQNIFVEDLREEFVRDYVFPMFRANALYEGAVSARHLDRAAADRQEADRDRGKGRRRCGGARRHRQGQRPGALRARLLRAQTRHQVDRAVAGVGPASRARRSSHSPSSTRSRSRRTSGARRRSPSTPICCTPRPRARSWRTRRRRSPDYRLSAHDRSRRMRPTRPIYVAVEFEQRRCRRARRQVGFRPRHLLAELNELGRANGIGRLDLVENRFVGMKSRGLYETPGGTILLAAHRGDRDRITLDRGAAHLKDELMPRYAELIYNGFWFAPEREMLQAADRQIAGVRDRIGAAQALQGQCRGGRARPRPIRSTIRTSSPSRTTRAPTTSATPPGSSG